MNTNQGMTIRQIADLCNVSERTVLDWAWKAAAKTAEESAAEIAPEDTAIGRKLKESGHGKPALLEINMLLDAIRAGGRATLADLLADNAARTAALPVPVNQSAIEAQAGAVGIYRDLISQQKALIQSQAIAIEFLTKEIQNLRRDAVTRMTAGLLSDGSDGEAWVNTTELAAVYGKTRATTLSHARARGWPMRRGQLESGSFTFEFLVSGLPEKLQDALNARKEAADAQ